MADFNEIMEELRNTLWCRRDEVIIALRGIEDRAEENDPAGCRHYAIEAIDELKKVIALAHQAATATGAPMPAPASTIAIVRALWRDLRGREGFDFEIDDMVLKDIFSSWCRLIDGTEAPADIVRLVEWGT